MNTDSIREMRNDLEQIEITLNQLPLQTPRVRMNDVDMCITALIQIQAEIIRMTCDLNNIRKDM